MGGGWLDWIILQVFLILGDSMIHDATSGNTLYEEDASDKICFFLNALKVQETNQPKQSTLLNSPLPTVLTSTAQGHGVIRFLVAA